jgi:hypothetical protein
MRTITVAAALLALIGNLNIAKANLLANGGMDTIGPNGTPVTVVGLDTENSAAKEWAQFNQFSHNTIVTNLEATTDPLGAINMLHVTITGPDLASGIQQDFDKTYRFVDLSFDLKVVSGDVIGGLVIGTPLAGDGFAADIVSGPTGGSWKHFDVVSGPEDVGRVDFEQFGNNPDAGTEWYIDNVSASLVPAVAEPSGEAILLLTAVGCLRRWRTRFLAHT